jgi:hypothetical protein
MMAAVISALAGFVIRRNPRRAMPIIDIEKMRYDMCFIFATQLLINPLKRPVFAGERLCKCNAR